MSACAAITVVIIDGNHRLFSIGLQDADQSGGGQPFFDPENPSLNPQTMDKAARALGKRLDIQLVEFFFKSPQKIFFRSVCDLHIPTSTYSNLRQL